MRVLIDSYDADENTFIGRTEGDAPDVDNEVIVDYSDDINIGQLYEMDIYDASEFELYAKLA